MGRMASMSWEREVWVQEHQGGESIAEIARKHNISRKALYKWLARYQQFGEEGLKDLSRVPEQHPQAVGEIWQERIGAARRGHPRWGAPKLAWWLEREYSEESRPSVSTIGRVLRAAGLSRRRRPRNRAPGTGPLQAAEHCNEVWCIDFKGWCRTGDGQRCEPLTVTDQASRYLLCCQGLSSTRTELVRPVLERVFQEYGLPQILRSDNGAPFASTGACGLTELSVWWIELGVECERIQAGRPQQNGRHERMHRTLKEETMNPPARSLRQQQCRFDAFVQHYNRERPHEALGQQLPAALYQRSPRVYPERNPEPQYAPHWRVRKVSDGGQTRWNRGRLFVSHALAGKHIGFEPIGDGLWRVWFYGHWLGTWDERAEQLRRPRSLD